MLTSPDPVDFRHVLSRLGQGDRAILYIRHSERPPLPTDDKAFGRTLGLTPRGVELARAAGRLLAGCTDVRFLASPMIRCQMTARHLAEGMGLADPAIEDADRLGVDCFYYREPLAVQEIMRQRGYMAYMLDYLRAGHAPHSNPIGPATEQMAAWLTQRATRRLGVFVSHDIFIAAFLTGLGVRRYSEDNWIGFLHGAALLQAPGAAWVCHPCVPDLEAPAAAAEGTR